MNMVTKLFFCIRRSFKGLKDGGYSVLYLYPHLKNFSSKSYLSGCNNEALTKDGKPLQDLLSGAFQVVHLLLLRPPPTFISLIIAPTLRFLSKVSSSHLKFLRRAIHQAVLPHIAAATPFYIVAWMQGLFKAISTTCDQLPKQSHL